MTQEAIWIVDDDPSIRWVLEKALSKAHIPTRVFESGRQVLHALHHERPKVLFSDIRMPQMDGLSLLDNIQQNYTHIPVIIMTAHSDLDSTVSAFKHGAFEYLAKPFDINDAVDLAKRALEHSQAEAEAEQAAANIQQQTIIGKSPAIQKVFHAIGRLSLSSISVLITGESGTGKELIARALHAHSPRAKKSFIALNTAAIPKDLLESELFGHEKGAFTGAHAQRKGRFEQAHEGTLFLDEIGDMPAELQTRLLRVLADGEFYRVGGHTPVNVNVRIVAATHQDLEKRVAEGLFREDLYHRLNVIHIHSPALRERTEDIPLLLNFFLNKSADELQTEIKSVSEEVVNYLQTLPWKGNIRQLENTARWLTVMASGHEILMDDLPAELMEQQPTQARMSATIHWQYALAEYTKHCLENGETHIMNRLTPIYEKIMIEQALQKTHGRKKEAADLLGIGRNTLTRKLAELDFTEKASAS
ncbi:MAG: nitrogen regulation protein NR(I) [bacterium]